MARGPGPGPLPLAFLRPHTVGVIPVDALDVVVIGAGTVGLAVATELSRERAVAVLERHGAAGLENSSHNSGVIHAGLYYPPGWLKTSLCIEGNRLLYAWAEEQGVRHRRTGKLVIAADEADLAELDALERAARANGVPNIHRLSAAEANDLEPHVRCAGALFSGSSGIVDQMGLIASYQRVAAARGALLAFRHRVEAIARRSPAGFVVRGAGPDGAPFAIEAGAVVNCAGMAADRLAATLGYDLDGGSGTPRMRHRLNKGRYYDIVDPVKARLVSRLVYPVPHRDRAGLGVHLTVDLDGGARLGPDTEWLPSDAEPDFRSADDRRDEFLASARSYLPWVEREDLAPGQVGYRPKLSGPGEPPRDFLIWHDRGYVHLGGIESPGLTASLAIAGYVRDLLRSASAS
jgi:L-2-hydroxyglutarate oxidase LhgO